MPNSSLQRPNNRHRRTWQILTLTFSTVGLTILFWWPLWAGGGLVGGDTLTYFFPQKTFLSDQLAHGRLPLWNNLSGHGYPALAESQTGICYPPTLLLYSVFDVNTAYNANLILHYLLAFWLTWNYARQVGLRFWAAMFAVVVFVYGWFPARIHFEWSILTGAWLPGAFWCTEAYLQRRKVLPLLLLSLVLSLQLLVGHFALTFITLVGVAAYLPLRLWFSSRESAETTADREVLHISWVVGAIALAFCLAAVQLIPTWELKQQSHRAAKRPYHDISYGRIPPEYLLQVVAPWHFYSDGYDINHNARAGAPETNKVEAHLYIGLIPLLFFVGGLIGRVGRGRPALPPWLIIGLASFLITPGWLSPLFRHLPGFSYFGGPGRYGILVTMAAALWCGAALDDFLKIFRRPFQQVVVLTAVFSLTLADLYLVYKAVNPAYVLSEAVIHRRLKNSSIRLALENAPKPLRIFGPGQNLLNCIQIAATPNFLGLAPAAYFDPDLRFPGEFSFDNPPEQPRPGQVDWLRRAGVTHILTFNPINTENWPVRPVSFDGRGIDTFLHVAFNRLPSEPMFLYELEGTRGRVSWVKAAEDKSAHIVEYDPGQMVVEAESPNGGRLVLTDLYYPGWRVSIDGKLAKAVVVESMYLGVDVPAGIHRIVWRYRPASVAIGALASVVALVVWLILLIRCRKRQEAIVNSAEGPAKQ